MRSNSAVTGGLILLSTLLGARGADAQGEIRLGQTVSGTLDAADMMMSDDSRYDLWVFEGQPGQQVIITLRSGDFDTYLSVGTFDDGEFDVQESDDDGAGGTDSQLRFTLRDSRLLIRANSLSPGQTGSYRLAVEPGQRSTPERLTIRGGQRMTGTLSHSDAVYRDGSYYDEWVYEGQAGQRIRITLRSNDFDTYLHFGVMEGGEFQEIESDDDGANSGTDSQIEVTLTASGSYRILANSLDDDETGSYTISVDEVR